MTHRSHFPAKRPIARLLIWTLLWQPMAAAALPPTFAPSMAAASIAPLGAPSTAPVFASVPTPPNVAPPAFAPVPSSPVLAPSSAPSAAWSPVIRDVANDAAMLEQNSGNAVRPILECVVQQSATSYVAHFGYRNENSVPATIAIGNNNKFSPTPQGRGQPTVFQPGRSPFYPNAAFTVAFNGSNLVWTLRGPDDQARTATASSSSTRCALPGPTIAITAPAANTLVRGPNVTVTGTISGGTAPLSVAVNGVAATLSGTSYMASVPLADGARTLTAVVTGAGPQTATATRNITVDSTGPVIVVTAPAANASTTAASITVTGTVTDGCAVTVTVNGVNTSLTNGAFSRSVSLALGVNTITIVATDAVGNQSTATRTVTRVAGPTLAVRPILECVVQQSATSYVAYFGYLNDNAVAVTIPVGTNNKFTPTPEGRGQPTSFAPGRTPFYPNAAFSVPFNGSNLVWTLRGPDNQSRTSTASSGSTRCTTPSPTVTLTAPAASAIVRSPITVTGTVNGGTAPVTVSVNGVAATVSSGTFTASIAAPSGALTITATATDAGARTGTATRAVTVDSTAPTLTITAPADGLSTAATSIVVTGTVADASTTTVTVNGTSVPVSGGAFSTTVALALGVNTIAIVASDAAGNQATTTRTVTRTANAPPTVTITSPTSGAVVGSPITVTGTVAGGTAPYTVSVNGTAATMTGATFSATLPASAGALTITATATDSTALTGQATVTVSVDATAPTLTIASPASGAVVRGPLVAVSGTAADAGGNVNVTVNGDPAAVVAGAFATTVPSADGPLTITVVASDTAGNSTTVTVSVTVDSAPPALTIATPASGALVNTPLVTISGTVADGSVVTVSIGGAAVPVTGGTFTYAAPTGTDGTQVYIVTATDAAGNETTQSVNVVVDRTVPTLSVSAPVDNAFLSTLPLTVQGLVTDLTPTVVTVNGVTATRVADAWEAVLPTLADGVQTLTIVATDAAGNQSTITRQVTLDASAPIVTITAPAAATLTRLGTVTVTGTVTERALTSVTVSGVAAAVTPVGGDVSAFIAAVPLAEGDVTLVVTATDSTGRTATAQVTVTRDSTAPLVDVAAPARVTQRTSSTATATVSASDTLALAQLVVTLNGTVVVTSPTAPVSVPLTVPPGAAVGDVLTLVAVATDTAGNAATATRTVRITGDGAVVGQVLSDTTGLAVSGALVQLGTAQATTDARGQYAFPTADASAMAVMTFAGTLPVDRTVAVAPEVGTVMVDARLTPLAEPVVMDVTGGTVSAGPIALVIPAGAVGAGTSVRLTRLSPQGLPGLLPLGWSPLTAFDVQTSTLLGAGASAQVAALPAGITALTVARYNPVLHTWTALAVDVPVTAGALTTPVDAAGSYALVVPDVQTPPLPTAVNGAPLPSAAVVAIPLTATSAGVVSPAVLPPTGGVATGLLAVQSPLVLPSGTLVQAHVTETFTLTTGAVASDEPRRQDVILYRTPAPDAAALPSGFVTAVSATFPIAPSRTYGAADLVQGVVHLDILAGREGVRGQVGGGLPTTVTSGGARVVVAGGSVPTDTVITLTPTVVSSFLPTASGVEALAELTLDLAGQTLASPAELSVSAAGLTIAPTDTLLVARVDRVDGVPLVVVVAVATPQTPRLVTVATPGLPGVTRGGRYVFYRVTSPVGWIAATVTSAGGPTPGVLVTDTGLPFVGLTPSTGQTRVPATPGPHTLTARLPRSVLVGTASVTVTAGATTPVAIALVGTVLTATVTPTDGATGVAVSAQVQITSPAVLAAGATIAAVTLTQTLTHTAVPVRLQLSSSGQLVAVIPTTRLTPATTYRLEALGLPTTTGDTVLVPATTFTTAAETALVVDATRLVVGMPDATGVATITAPPGTFPPGTQVLIVNTGNGVVLSLTAGNDGSLTGSIQAATFDRLLLTITDPQGRTTSLQRSTFVAADGTTAVGSGGGVVTGPGGVALRVPEGAIATAATFRVEAIDYAATFPTDPPAALPSATLGPAMRIVTDHPGRFAREIDLAFPRPAAAPDGAFFYVVRRQVGAAGQVLYETLDHAWEEGSGPTATVVTASEPFAGYGVGGIVAGIALVYWSFAQALPRRSNVGVITGTLRRPQIVAGQATPLLVPVEGAEVRAVHALGPDGQPVAGTLHAVSQANGTFALHDPVASGGTLEVVAVKDGVEVRGVAYQPGPEYVRSDALLPYNTYVVVNLQFPPLVPPPPTPAITIRAYREVTGTRVDTGGVVTVNEPLTLVFTVPSPVTNPVTMRAADVNGTAIALSPDTVAAPSGSLAFAASYTPPQVGTLTIVGYAQPVTGPLVSQTYVARVVSAGGGVTPVPDAPPAVIDARTVPRRASTGAAVTVYPQVSFTEPVTNVVGAVTLTDPQGTTVPIMLLGTGLTGPIPQVQSGSVVTGLTIQPLVGLRFNATYTLTLTSAIVDQDTPAKPLVAYTTTFTTFGPEAIGGTTEPVGASAIQAVGDRVYVADWYNRVSPRLRVFDVRDPVTPTEIVGPGDAGYQVLHRSTPVITGIGAPTDLAVEDASALTGGRVLATTVAPAGIPYRPSNVWVYDVSDDQTWHLLAAVTLGTEPLDGIARRVVLKGERLLALTTGLGKGVQVVDLAAARAQLQQQTGGVDGYSLPMAQLLQSLHTLQQGFGQGAIVATIPIDTGTGSNSQQQDMAVLDTLLDGTLTPLVITTGRAPFVLVDPNAAQVIPTGALLSAQLTYGAYVAAAFIQGQPYAAVVGLSPTGGYRLVTVSLTNPRIPVIAGVLDLPPGVLDAGRTRLVLKDGMAYLGGSAGTTILNLQDPAQPTVAGVIAGTGGLVALTDNNLLVSAADLYRPAQGLQTAALGRTPLVSVTPNTIAVDRNTQAAEAFDVTAALLPSESGVTSGVVQFLTGNTVVGERPVTLNGGLAVAHYPVGTEVSAPSLRMRLVTDPGTPLELFGPSRPVPLDTVSIGPVVPVTVTADEPILDVLAVSGAHVARVFDSPGATTAMAWEVLGVTGTRVTPNPSASNSGVFKARVEFPTAAGQSYQLTARLPGSDRLNTSQLVNVASGPAAAIALSAPRTSLPADEASTVVVTALLRDVAGNLVADGTPVVWDVRGDGSLDSAVRVTTGGLASAVYRAGRVAGLGEVLAAADRAFSAQTVTLEPLSIAVTMAETSLTTNQGPVAASIVVTSAAGPPADNAVLTLVGRLGKIIGQTPLTGGTASAAFRPLGASGAGFVAAIVGAARTEVPVTVQSPGVSVSLARSAFVGDQATDGAVTVERLDGAQQAYPYVTGTVVQVRGAPGERVDVTLGDAAAPNVEPIALYAMDDLGAGSVPDEYHDHPGATSPSGVTRDVTTRSTGVASARFSGSGVVTIPDAPALSPTTGVGVALDFRARVAASATLLDKSGGYALRLVPAGPLLRVQAVVDTSAGTQTLESAPVALDTWHAVAMGHVSGRFVLHVDGVSVELAALGPIEPRAGPLVLGQDFDGHLDNVRVYDYARPALLAFANGTSRMSVTVETDGMTEVPVQATGVLRTGSPNEAQISVLSEWRDRVLAPERSLVVIYTVSLLTSVLLAIEGFVVGNPAEIEQYAGDLVAGFVAYGDVRDLVIGLYHWSVGQLQTGDYVVLSLAAIGILTTVFPPGEILVTTAKIGAKALRQMSAVAQRWYGELALRAIKDFVRGRGRASAIRAATFLAQLGDATRRAALDRVATGIRGFEHADEVIELSLRDTSATLVTHLERAGADLALRTSAERATQALAEAWGVLGYATGRGIATHTWPEAAVTGLVQYAEVAAEAGSQGVTAGRRIVDEIVDNAPGALGWHPNAMREFFAYVPDLVRRVPNGVNAFLRRVKTAAQIKGAYGVMRLLREAPEFSGHVFRTVDHRVLPGNQEGVDLVSEVMSAVGPISQFWEIKHVANIAGAISDAQIRRHLDRVVDQVADISDAAGRSQAIALVRLRFSVIATDATAAAKQQLVSRVQAEIARRGRALSGFTFGPSDVVFRQGDPLGDAVGSLTNLPTF